MLSYFWCSNPGADVRFGFFGLADDESHIGTAISTMVERGRLGNVSLVPSWHDVRKELALKLQVIILTFLLQIQI